MIPLGAGDIPASGPELAKRISNAVNGIVKPSGDARPDIQCDMSDPETINSLTVNLTNVESSGTKAEKPSALTRMGDVSVKSFKIVGDPVIMQGAPVTLDIIGKNLPMSWSRDDRGNLWIVPSRNNSQGDHQGDNAFGHARISAETSRIEQAVKAVAAELANANGAKLKDLRLRIESAGPRSLLIKTDITASKFMMTAKVHILAGAVLDDAMNLRVTDLDVKGDGATGSMLANMVGDKLALWRGKTIALGEYMFAGAALEDVSVHVDDHVKLSATFGKKTDDPPR